MSDVWPSVRYVPNYQGAAIVHEAYGERRPREIQSRLREQFKVEVTLRLIRQLWLHPQLRHLNITVDDVIGSFRLFHLLVRDLPLVRGYVRRLKTDTSGYSAETWVRMLVATLYSQPNRKKDAAAEMMIPDELLRDARLLAVAQLLYMVEIAEMVDESATADEVGA
jgi:hypothetical protein